jgi:hypothetical protein
VNVSLIRKHPVKVLLVNSIRVGKGIASRITHAKNKSAYKIRQLEGLAVAAVCVADVGIQSGVVTWSYEATVT